MKYRIYVCKFGQTCPDTYDSVEMALDAASSTGFYCFILDENDDVITSWYPEP